jgi:hypothetical protein
VGGIATVNMNIVERFDSDKDLWGNTKVQYWALKGR